MSTYLTVDSNRMTKFKDFRHTRTPVGLLRYKRHNTKSCQATHHLMVHVLNHQYESMTDQRCCKNGYSFSISILSNCQEQGLFFGNRYWTRIASHTKPNNPFTNPKIWKCFFESGLVDSKVKKGRLLCSHFETPLRALKPWSFSFIRFSWDEYCRPQPMQTSQVFSTSGVTSERGIYSFGQRFGCIFVACCSFSGFEKPNRSYGPFICKAKRSAIDLF